MIKRIFTLIFILTIVGNALAAFPPHSDGEGGCSTECCQTARQDGAGAVLSRLCCITECPQPAENSGSTTTTVILTLQQPGGFADCFLPTPEPASYIRQTRFPSSPTRSLHGSSTRYLDTGSLLI